MQIQSLVAQLSASSELVQKNLASKPDVFFSTNKKAKSIQQLCKNHIQIHQILEVALNELYTSDEEVKISEEVVEAFKKSQATVEKITSAQAAHSPKLVKIILQDATPVVADKNPLVIPTQARPIEKHHFEWHLNTALLMDVHKQTSDPALKKQIEFLILNYLTKAATVGVDGNTDGDRDSGITEQLKAMTQVGAFDELTVRQYHRESDEYEKVIIVELKEELASKGIGQLIVIDTEEVDSLLPVSFSVIPTQEDNPSSTNWTQHLDMAMKEHRSKYGENWNDHPIDPPLLIDSSKLVYKGQSIQQLIKTNHDPEKEKEFILAIEEIKKMFALAIDNMTDPTDTQKAQAIKNFLLLNTIFICRTTLKDVGVLARIDVLQANDLVKETSISSCLGTNLAKNNWRTVFCNQQHRTNGKIASFVDRTGIRLGRVNSRIKFLNFVSIQEVLERAGKTKHSQLTDYGQPVGTNGRLYRTQDALMKTHLFQEFKKIVSQSNVATSAPHIAILGKATIELLEGLLGEINIDKWEDLHYNPDTRLLVQTSLFRIMQHLSVANSHAFSASLLANNPLQEAPQVSFTEFAQAIELIHCEIATLLAIAMPFNEGDFDEIYKNQLTCVPKGLRKHLKVGITKSAMNTVAGINRAVLEGNPQAGRAYMAGSYFESRLLMGDQRTSEDLIADTSIKTVDLYVREFNENVSVHLSHSHYVPADMIAEIDALLKAKPDTKELTIAVDSTIDYVNSPRAQAVLEHYATQIQEGKLNFVFFRSGQKFDMLGMDNYYGSPFYMVNNSLTHNGDEKWGAFNDLMHSPVHKTDPLSMQWFCLANKYALSSMDEYRKRIFRNHRILLNRIKNELPELLPQSGQHQEISVSTADPKMDSAFIALKVFSKQPGKMIELLEKLYHQEFLNKGALAYERGSFGFYMPNLNLLAAWEDKGKGQRIVRFNLGLDPSGIHIMMEVLKKAL